MNIAMFTDAFFPRINGVSVSVLSFAKELSRDGSKICIVCPDYSDTSNMGIRQKFHSYTETIPCEGNDITVFRVASDKIIWSNEDRLAKITSWHHLKHFLDDEFKPDLIHINSEYIAGRFGSHYAKHRKLPLVYTFHTYWEEYCKNYARLAPSAATRAFGREISLYFLRRATNIIAPTFRIEEVIRKYGISKSVHILPTGISSDVSCYDEEKAVDFNKKFYDSFPAAEGKRIMLYIGRVAAEKNLNFLLDVMEEVRKKKDDVCLVVVGDGEYLPVLKEAAAKLPYFNNIFFPGYCSRDQLAYYYKLADVFVFPSLTETQGLVTIEAMSAGLPVVAIGEMGTLDVMQGDNGGFMIKNDGNTIHEFTDRVVELLTDKELHHKKSLEAIEWSRKWSIVEITKKLTEIFEEAVAINNEQKTM